MSSKWISNLNDWDYEGWAKAKGEKGFQPVKRGDVSSLQQQEVHKDKCAQVLFDF